MMGSRPQEEQTREGQTPATPSWKKWLNIGRRKNNREVKLFLPETIYDLGVGWYIHVKRIQLKHELSANKYEIFNFCIGYPAVILQAIIGVSVFATFTESESTPFTPFKIAAICLTLISAGLVALQNFGGYAKEAEKHRLAASRFKSIIQEFEYQLLKLKLDHSASKDNDGWLGTLRKDYQKVENDSPQSFWPCVSERVDTLPMEEITDFLSKAYKTNGSDRSMGTSSSGLFTGHKDTVDGQPKPDQ
jgi:hypothetical protein